MGINAPGSLREEAEYLDVPGRLAGEEFLGRVQPEAGDALVHPESHDVPNLRPQLQVVQVQIRHSGPEFALILPGCPFHRVIIGGFGLLIEEIVVHIGTFLQVRLPAGLQ